MKKNEMGFTLIEMMGVIVIISLIAILTFPNIVNQIKKSKKVNNDNIDNALIAAAKKYASDNSQKYRYDVYCIKISELISNDYIKEDIVKGYSEDITEKGVFINRNTSKITDSCYTRVEYIGSTGSQFIDTLYIPKTNTKLVLDIKFSGTFDPESGNIFSSNNFDTSSFQLNFGGQQNQYNKLFAWLNETYSNGGEKHSITVTDEILNNKNTITMQSGLITYGSVSEELDEKTYDNDISMILFGERLSGSGNARGFRSYNMYVFSLKLYEGDQLKRDFIPVLDFDDVACLYDRVEDKFYYNQGTGEFLYE